MGGGERRAIVAVAMALALLCGCASQKQPAVEMEPDQRAKLLTLPDEYKTRKNPLPPLETNLNEGRARYEEYCAACHGRDGKADTPLGRSLYPRATDLTSAHVQQHSDGELFWIVAEGIRYSGMPAGRRLHTESQIWKIVLHLRQLARPPTSAASRP